MQLFYKPGACSMAAHIILNETGASYATEKVDTDNGVTETGQAYAKINPRGYVPALQLENGDIITENVAVLQYLGDHFADHGLVPEGGTVDRARLFEMLSFLSSELHKGFSPFFSGKELSDAEKASVMERLTARITQFDAMMPSDAPFLLGDRFSVADAYAFVILNWSNFTGVSLSPWPRIEAFMARVAARPAVQTTLEQEGLAA